MQTSKEAHPQPVKNESPKSKYGSYELEKWVEKSCDSEKPPKQKYDLPVYLNNSSSLGAKDNGVLDILSGFKSVTQDQQRMSNVSSYNSPNSEINEELSLSYKAFSNQDIQEVLWVAA